MIVPVLGVVDVLAATLYAIAPFPVPLAPEAIVIHDTELVAVQAHPLPVPTFTLLNAGAEVSDTLVVESTTAHSGAAWVTEKTRPPIVIEPVLAVLDVFVAIEY